MTSNLTERRQVAADRVRKAYECFGPGTGFGDPGAELEAKMELDAARFELDQVDAEIREATANQITGLTMQLQRHQIYTAWVAVVVGVLAAIPGLIALFRK